MKGQLDERPIRVTVPAGSGWATTVQTGETVVVTDLHGQQAVDLVAYSFEDLSESYSVPLTVKLNGRLRLQLGDRLYSVAAREMLRVVEDSCGEHDTVLGCCRRDVNEMLYGRRGEGSCFENFLESLAPWGIDGHAITGNVNLFMTSDIRDDASIGFAPGHSVAGDRVGLAAAMDLVVAVSACPQVLNPASGYEPTSIQVEVLPAA